MYIMENLPYTHRKRAQSFSSSLLDAIYRSIDESKSTNIDNNNNKETSHTNNTLKHINFSRNHNHRNSTGREDNKVSGNSKYHHHERMNLRRAVMLEDNSSQFMNSSSVTSTSSVFSSSDTDTISHINNHNPINKREGGGGGRTSFARTKLRALKIYGELNQKVRHPISPGSRIASFLSSIFNSGNVKKAKMCSVSAAEDVTFDHNKSKSPPCFSNSSTVSSSASFPRRSCMSKASSSSKGNKTNHNGAKRSVRFYPVSVILGAEDSGQRYSNYNESDPSLLPLPSVRKINARSSSIKELKKKKKKKKNFVDEVIEASARGFIDGYNRSSGKGNVSDFYHDEEEGDDDDALSYSSSDLFELDHIIGGAGTRYQEELPVYETTNLETNKAIANGLC